MSNDISIYHIAVKVNYLSLIIMNSIFDFLIEITMLILAIIPLSATIT